MRFWDSSAVVPLLTEQPTSRSCRAALRADPRLLVWCLTPIEAHSALRRLVREGGLGADAYARSASRLERHTVAWTEIDALGPVRDQAHRLLDVHALTASDALQLGAALVAFDLRPRKREFVCLDDALTRAARAEGFTVVVPSG